MAGPASSLFVRRWLDPCFFKKGSGCSQLPPGGGGGNFTLVTPWHSGVSQGGIGPPCSKQPGRPGLTPPVSSTPSLGACPSETAPPPRARGRRHNPADTLRPSSSLFPQYVNQIAVWVSDSYIFFIVHPIQVAPVTWPRGSYRTNTLSPPPTIPSPCRPPLRPPLLSPPVGGDPGLFLRRGGVASQHPGQTPSMEWGPPAQTAFCDRLMLNPWDLQEGSWHRPSPSSRAASSPSWSPPRGPFWRCPGGRRSPPAALHFFGCCAPLVGHLSPRCHSPLFIRPTCQLLPQTPRHQPPWPVGLYCCSTSYVSPAHAVSLSPCGRQCRSPGSIFGAEHTSSRWPTINPTGNKDPFSM